MLFHPPSWMMICWILHKKPKHSAPHSPPEHPHHACSIPVFWLHRKPEVPQREWKMEKHTLPLRFWRQHKPRGWATLLTEPKTQHSTVASFLHHRHCSSCFTPSPAPWSSYRVSRSFSPPDLKWKEVLGDVCGGLCLKVNFLLRFVTDFNNHSSSIFCNSHRLLGCRECNWWKLGLWTLSLLWQGQTLIHHP